MQRHTVDTVMTREVVSVYPDASFKKIAELLSEHDISAVPVTDFQGRVIGIVSEADLIGTMGDPPQRRRWARHPSRMRSATLVAADLMTTPAKTVAPATDITMAAQLLTARKIKCLPVVDAENCPVGIVSRHDLVGLFVRSDDAIKTEIEDDGLLRALCVDPVGIEVAVHEGVVMLLGHVERRSQVAVAVTLIRRVTGVVDVTDRLTYAVDDTDLQDGTASRHLGLLHTHWANH
jgi:CBS-domain-containing membrane protein